MPASAARPVLWHLAMSHYNEKARWALDYKQLPHTRRAVMPGVHAIVAKRLGGRTTFPVMTIGDAVFPDSTDIIAALEELVPEPPLYPADPALRAQALELEDELDRELGPAVRRLGYQRILNDKDAATTFLAAGGPPLRKTMLSAGFGPMSTRMRAVFEILGPDDPRSVTTIEHYLELIEERSADTGFLVGDRFSVADLTAASLLAIIVCPDAMPGPPLPPFPAGLRELLGPPLDRPGGAWADRIYRTYRPGAR